mgnify:CR=1 FL=1
MRAFATLINRLDSTNKTNQKLEAIQEFLKDGDDQDKLWFLALFTGKRPKRVLNTTLMRSWLLDLVNLPEWLFLESYASVGDLSETISLMLPAPSTYVDYSLSEWMEKILDLKNKTDDEKKAFVMQSWDSLPHIERFIFNKLLGGSFRVGISSQSLINAIASFYQLEPSAVSHSIMGEWTMENTSFDKLIQGEYSDSSLSKPYPFCLVHPIGSIEETLTDLSQWSAEYKWDGIRGQIIKRKGEVFIWSRGEELVSKQFPELLDAFLQWEGDFVLDGEILAWKDGQILNFSMLQKRLNRKVLSQGILEEVPVGIFLYDLLELDTVDWRDQTFIERRAALTHLYQQQIPVPNIRLSELVSFQNLEDLKQIRLGSRAINSEGLMLKNKSSKYHVGRKRGDWWKWKVDPYSIDAVLIYAQKGSGRRSSFYTDYTFAVKDGDQLVTIAKAYSGLTDVEIKEVSRFVNANSIEKFGPVRTVKPSLVFEIAFEGISWSNRHKAGVALRFPRIARWRKDKDITEIDDLTTLKELIKP